MLVQCHPALLWLESHIGPMTPLGNYIRCKPQPDVTAAGAPACQTCHAPAAPPPETHGKHMNDEGMIVSPLCPSPVAIPAHFPAKTTTSVVPYGIGVRMRSDELLLDDWLDQQATAQETMGEMAIALKTAQETIAKLEAGASIVNTTAAAQTKMATTVGELVACPLLTTDCVCRVCARVCACVCSGVVDCPCLLVHTFICSACPITPAAVRCRRYHRSHATRTRSRKSMAPTASPVQSL